MRLVRTVVRWAIPTRRAFWSRFGRRSVRLKISATAFAGRVRLQMVDGPPRQHPEPQPEDGLRHVFPTPIWTFSFPRADVVNPILRKVILEAAQSYPSQGRSNVGGWRSRNDLFHWEAPEVKEIGAWIMDCVRRIVEATAAPDRFRGTISAVGWASVCRTGNYNAPHSPSRFCLVGRVLRRYGRPRRDNAIR